MRNIVLALIIAVGAGALLYLLATVLGFPAEVAKGAAGLPAFSIQKVYEFLEASSAKHALETTGLGPTMSVKDFSIHPLSAFLFSLIAWTGVFLFTGMLMGMAVGLAQGVQDIKLDDKLLPPLIIFTSYPLSLLQSISAAGSGLAPAVTFWPLLPAPSHWVLAWASCSRSLR